MIVVNCNWINPSYIHLLKYLDGHLSNAWYLPDLLDNTVVPKHLTWLIAGLVVSYGNIVLLRMRWEIDR